jgi:WD40 repeat protein/serine/threonine protein kinase
MGVCPTRSELEDFLSDRLPADGESVVLTHLESCATCQQVLESLTAGSLGESGQSRPDAARMVPPEPDGKTPHALPPRIGQYTLIRELGQGGMGVVYLAEQANLKRAVALKVIRHGVNATPEEVARFCAEAEAVARLQHANIVQIHEVGCQGGVYYLALEYVNGGSLDRHLAGTPQEPQAAAGLIETLARAIHHAHQRGILHRDLKPANILLQEDLTQRRQDAKEEQQQGTEPETKDASGPFHSASSGLCVFASLREVLPKITDFGMAKRLEPSDAHTRSGLVLGTPSYMAPEQASGKHGQVTVSVDVYGLGALLYELLTGRPPFKGATALSTLEQVASQEPVAPSRFQRHIPRDLETICLKCLEKDPGKRYASAEALADDLGRFLSGRPIVARPVRVWGRLWKWARRRPALAGMSVAIVLVTAAALALVTWQWRRAQDEAVQARQNEARLALQQGQALCERGDLGPGLLWLARALDRAASAGAAGLDRPARVNLAAWGGQLHPAGTRLDNPGAILGLAFGPDDRTLLAAGKDGCVHCWDLDGGREAGPPLVHPRPAPTWVGYVEFSPDGRTIATAGHEAALLWDAATHKPDGAPLPHPPGMLWGMAFFPDGRRLATCSDDGSARVWDLATRRVALGPYWHQKGDPGYYTLAVSPDGKTLVTAGSDGRAIRWDLGTGNTIGPPLQHDSCVLKALFTRDGTRLLTSTRGGTLHAWDLQTGRRTDLPRQGTEINGLALAPDGRRFASATDFGVVRLWDTATLLPAGPMYRYSVGVCALAFSRDGRRLALGMLDGGIQVVELPPSGEAAPPAPVAAEVCSLQYTAGGDRLMAGTKEGVRWVEAATGRTLEGRLKNPEDWDIACAALSPGGRSLAVGRWAKTAGFPRGRLQWWDPAAGVRLDETPDQPEPVRVVVYSPDGRKLFACGNQPGVAGGAALWDVATGQQLRPLLRSLGQVLVRQAAFDPSGRVLLLACSDGRARLWDTEADAEVDPQRPLAHAGAVMACAFDPDGRRALTGSQDGTARLWDVAARRPLVEPLRHDAEVSAVAFSPDGQTLLTASLDGIARFWDAGSGKSLGPTLVHPEGVRTVAFDRDGRRAATGGRDGAVRQWRLPPPPLEGSPERIRLWAEVLTGIGLDLQGAVHELSAEDLAERRRRLMELGGPPRIPVPPDK